MSITTNDNLKQSVSGLIQDYPWLRDGGIGVRVAEQLEAGKMLVVYRNEMTKTTTVYVAGAMTQEYHDLYAKLLEELRANDPFVYHVGARMDAGEWATLQATVLLGICANNPSDQMQDFTAACVFDLAQSTIKHQELMPLVIVTKLSGTQSKLELVRGQ